MYEPVLVKIGGREIGQGRRCYVVAEVSANHCSNFHIAARTIVAAKEAGADAVKFQAYTPGTMTLDSDKSIFRAAGPWAGEKLHKLYERAALDWDLIPRLKRIADGAKIDFFCTAYDASSVDFLEAEVDPPVYKIASFELTDVPLLKRVAKTKKPVILSTGMATVQEIGDALLVLRESGCTGVILLKCTSAYPSPVEHSNLATMCDMMYKFKTPIGFSDHTSGIITATTAAALQACMIEKHFKLSNDIESPDASFSIEPVALRAMVQSIRVAQTSVGRVVYGSPCESPMRRYRRSLFAVKDIKSGEDFTADNVRVLRPAAGLAPSFYEITLRSAAKCDIEAGTPLTNEMLRNRPAKRRKAKSAKPKRRAKRKVQGK